VYNWYLNLERTERAKSRRKKRQGCGSGKGNSSNNKKLTQDEHLRKRKKTEGTAKMMSKTLECHVRGSNISAHRRYTGKVEPPIEDRRNAPAHAKIMKTKTRLRDQGLEDIMQKKREKGEKETCIRRLRKKGPHETS